VIAGIVLAAGLSARMGRPKQLLDWAGQPLVRHVARQALESRLDRVLVVISPAITGLAAALDGLPLTLVEQPDPARGQGSSLALGVAALPPGTQAAMVLLGDQPLIDAALIDRLLDAARASERTIVAPLIAGRRANPVLFKARWLPGLATLAGDQGARELIAANRDELLLVPLEASAADIDTEEDYQRLRDQG
jgi:molybdenum cofactor cytidylyltransferase